MRVEETDSTNTLLRELIAAGNPPEMVYAGFQTAGRGQAGNRWESEANKNLLCSILLPPRKNLFEMNIVVSVAVMRTIIGVSGLVDERMSGVEESGVEDFSIKWPNDIYWRDKKVAGILIENAIMGNEVKYSIAGIGLNINQIEWFSNAPNPISLKQIFGVDLDVDGVADRLLKEVKSAVNEDLWAYYKAHLYRREGFWPFVEREVSIEPTMNVQREEVESTKYKVESRKVFMARIEDILPTGEMVLEDQEGKKRAYHFKQVRYVL